MAEQDAAELTRRFETIRALVMDVDGVLTDGGIVLSSDGSEVKRFHVADGLGIQLARHAGLRVVWLTSRQSAIVERRARELQVSRLIQGAADKAAALGADMREHDLGVDEVAYVGDDLNDLPPMRLCGLRFAPANAAAEVKAEADLLLEKEGGHGAVREMCDLVLKIQGRWLDALTAYLADAVRM
ncbi:MAG: HAD hydrolase family protein [Chthonomonadales bacterium]|nr:HAD hydrolase family protein [Chthonomonadales bacterium]